MKGWQKFWLFATVLWSLFWAGVTTPWLFRDQESVTLFLAGVLIPSGIVFALLWLLAMMVAESDA